MSAERLSIELPIDRVDETIMPLIEQTTRLETTLPRREHRVAVACWLAGARQDRLMRGGVPVERVRHLVHWFLDEVGDSLLTAPERINTLRIEIPIVRNQAPVPTGRLFEVNALKHIQKIAIGSLKSGLAYARVRTLDGRLVDSNAAVLRYVLEQIDAAMQEEVVKRCSLCSDPSDKLTPVRLRVEGTASDYQRDVVTICGSCKKRIIGKFKKA